VRAINGRGGFDGGAEFGVQSRGCECGVVLVIFKGVLNIFHFAA
jgi:hypothetical protein